MNFMSLYVMDSNGASVEVDNVTAKSGYHNNYETRVGAEWNSGTELCVGEATYKVNKGTYYIRVYRGISGGGWAGGDGSLSLKATFPSSSSSASKISYLQVTIPKGSTLKLSAVISGNGTPTWTSSKKSVATVSSKGTVTAKTAGTTIITAKLGSSAVKIKVKVTA
ncbi:MAG: hypothetical protein E7478_00615 [Ruminococcaceae bacterium]|nr:hypothetical protein [Oscillospiraceae bacterium]